MERRAMIAYLGANRATVNQVGKNCREFARSCRLADSRFAPHRFAWARAEAGRKAKGFPGRPFTRAIMTAYTGTSGNDTFTGTSGADTFDMSQGGTDTVSGGSGNDTISFGATLDATDVVDGGAGNDTLNLTGDYSLLYTFSATNLTNVEKITLGHGYGLIIYDHTMPTPTSTAGGTLTIDASLLGIGQLFHFNGTAETDGKFNITGGQGDDNIKTGAGNDTIDISNGGEDRVNGEAGDDIIVAGAEFDDGDSITTAASPPQPPTTSCGLPATIPKA